MLWEAAQLLHSTLIPIHVQHFRNISQKKTEVSLTCPIREHQSHSDSFILVWKLNIFCRTSQVMHVSVWVVGVRGCDVFSSAPPVR